jgi:hypothetical protein
MSLFLRVQIKGLSKGVSVVQNIATNLSKKKNDGGCAYINIHGTKSSTTTAI